MNVVTIDVVVSIVSALVAVFSAAIAFYMFKMSKNNLERYDRELEFLRKQSRSHLFLELRSALDNINEKIVEWDLDLTDYEENENLTPKDKQVIVWIIHNLNLSIYIMVQGDIVESDYAEAMRRRTIHNIKKLIEVNTKARSWLSSLLSYAAEREQPSRIEQHLSDLIGEIMEGYD